MTNRQCYIQQITTSSSTYLLNTPLMHAFESKTVCFALVYILCAIIGRKKYDEWTRVICLDSRSIESTLLFVYLLAEGSQDNTARINMMTSNIFILLNFECERKKNCLETVAWSLWLQSIILSPEDGHFLNEIIFENCYDSFVREIFAAYITFC